MTTAPTTPRPASAWPTPPAMAGMAFANAFLGVNHSMAHKLGAYHHMPARPGQRLSSSRASCATTPLEVPSKMGTFPQYAYPHAKARYAEAARYCGVTGKNDDEVFENFVAKIEELKEKVGVKQTIAEYGVDEKDFLATLDEMTENAFNDQCTPRQPALPAHERDQGALPRRLLRPRAEELRGVNRELRGGFLPGVGRCRHESKAAGRAGTRPAHQEEP